MTKEIVSKQQNKGIHVPSDSFSSEFTSSKSKDEKDKSLGQMKKDLKAVIEHMGPNTPHFEQTMSVTEESVFPNTTTVSIRENKDEEDPHNQTDCDFSTLPPDVTIHESDLSMIVDNPTETFSIPQCVCPPPTFPANFVYNSECMCPQVAANYFLNTCPEANQKSKSEKCTIFHSFYKQFKSKKSNAKKSDYYTINIKQSSKNYGVPRRLVFDLVENMPKNQHQQCLCGSGKRNDCYLHRNGLNSIFFNENKDSKPEVLSSKTKKDVRENDILPADGGVNAICKNQTFNQKTSYIDSNGATRVDVYYFDHGCSNYFRTTDRTPVLVTEALAERTEAYTTKFWAELFGTFNIGFSFITSFVLQLFRFMLYAIIRPLTIGILQLISDYFFKPLLCAIFNAVIQPILIFLYNIASSVRDFCDPIAESIGYFIREVAVFIRAFRIVEIKKESRENVASNGSRRIFRKNNRLT